MCDHLNKFIEVLDAIGCEYEKSVNESVFELPFSETLPVELQGKLKVAISVGCTAFCFDNEGCFAGWMNWEICSWNNANKMPIKGKKPVSTGKRPKADIVAEGIDPKLFKDRDSHIKLILNYLKTKMIKLISKGGHDK